VSAIQMNVTALFANELLIKTGLGDLISYPWLHLEFDQLVFARQEPVQLGLQPLHLVDEESRPQRGGEPRRRGRSENVALPGMISLIP